MRALEKASSEEGEACQCKARLGGQRGSRSVAKKSGERSESEERSEGRSLHRMARGSEGEAWREGEGRREEGA